MTNYTQRIRINETRSALERTVLAAEERAKRLLAMITLIQLRQMAETVREIQGDNESAHGAEDRLMVACLTAIRDGIEHPEEVAAIGLSPQELDFDRRYA